ncbi:energy transducer TonB [Luteimonas terrae]|uniref:TonB family protein n=1 Tax=Luteimonas terrae TaxID=1530191 RepID=A0ABU1XWG1_9GAMM|nr:energy transducer TonB [Luteimonas terrae]MDR7193058.1 TonB family protein [Luteimonas terrae]
MPPLPTTAPVRSTPQAQASRSARWRTVGVAAALCLTSAASANGGAVPASGTHAGPAAASYGASIDIRSKNTQPARYPREAAQAGITGTVIVQVEVDAQGALQTVSVEKSSGSPALDTAAIEAARRWTYGPAMHEGAPTAGRVRIPVDFHL